LWNSWAGSFRPQSSCARVAYCRIYSTYYIYSTSILHTILSYIHPSPYNTTPFPNIILNLRSNLYPERFPTKITYTSLVSPSSTRFLLWFHCLNIIMADLTFTRRLYALVVLPSNEATYTSQVSVYIFSRSVSRGESISHSVYGLLM